MIEFADFILYCVKVIVNVLLHLNRLDAVIRKIFELGTLPRDYDL